MGITFITTGGTIDKAYFDEISEYEVGPPQLTEILRIGRAIGDFEKVSVLRKDSLELTDEDREMIRRAVLAARHERIVITHGTDTMIETALRLRDVPGRTIVLTGALSPAVFRESDAPFNVGMALGAVLSLPPGVYLVMNGQIFRPENVVKNRALMRFETSV